MRWVLLRPCNRTPYYDPEIQEPLGLEYLAAFRRQRNDAVLLLDRALTAVDESKLARRAVAFQPDVIGFSIMTAQELDSVQRMYTECRSALNGRSMRWIAGGNFVSTEPAQALKHLPAEFELVRFEGELVSDAIAASSGIVPGRIHIGIPVQDLDSLPFPERPFAEQIQSIGWAFNIQGSRGCCGTCRYCASPGMSTHASNRWRGRSPGNVVAEIEELHRRHGACTFNFVDEDFLGPNRLAAERAREFSREIQARRLHISFGIQVRPATLNEEIIELLLDVGLTYVFMGLESDDPEDFKRWARPWTPDPWRFVPQLRRRGAEVHAGVLLFHTHSTLHGIRRFARKLHDYGLLGYWTALNRLDAMPGSCFHTEGLRSGTITPEACGPQPLPFEHPEVELFRRNLIAAVAPLGPPSMHAICALPPLFGRRYLNGHAELIEPLERIIANLNNAVANTLFAMLDSQEQSGGNGIISKLRQQNLEVALSSVHDPVSHGLAPSVETLREAIRIDAGM